MKISLNVYTSLLFISNIFYLLVVNDIIYLISFAALLITSVLFHYTKFEYLLYIDKIATYNIVLQGGIRFLENYSKSLLISISVLLSFFSVVYLYIYGFMCNKFCFDEKYGELYHGLLHFLSCIGHLFIIALIKM